MLGVSNIYLQAQCSATVKNFTSVYSCNNLPTRYIRSGSLIANLSKFRKKGTHFIAIYLTPNVVYYFDPLGTPCNNKYILKFLKSQQRNIKMEHTQIQGIDSIMCGFFCWAYILARSERKFTKHFYVYFDSNFKKNDARVVKLIIKLLT